jgi:hypothetical protein
MLYRILVAHQEDSELIRQYWPCENHVTRSITVMISTAIATGALRHVTN